MQEELYLYPQKCIISNYFADLLFKNTDYYTLLHTFCQYTKSYTNVPIVLNFCVESMKGMFQIDIR